MMKIVAVDSRVTEEKFLQLPFSLYKGDSNWIAPLQQDIKKVFDPKKNNHFEHGECARWILEEDGKIVG